MKNKILISILFIIAMFGSLSFVNYSDAQTIWFSYISGQNFGKGCTVAVDVTMDAMWKKVATTDIVLESSMKYLDFIPNKSLFTYYFPPITRSNWLIHIVWFTVLPSQIITWSGSVWTLFFEANPTDMDASIRVYFLWTGNTTDTNLSFGWVDQLQSVWQANFVMDQTSCVHNVAVITWWFAWLTYQESLDDTINQLNWDFKRDRIMTFILSYWILVISIILIILFVIIYRKKILLLLKKRHLWEKLVS